jgi:hypothetical protein
MPARSLATMFTRDAGVFFVLAELTRRGWTAAATARNNLVYDILAKRGDEFAAIRVKSKTSDYTYFEWNAKPNGDVFLQITPEHDFCVLVDIPKDGDAGPIYYVVPTPDIDKWLRDDFLKWVTTPGTRGQHRPTHSRRRIFYLDNEAEKPFHGYSHKLASFKGAWNLFFSDAK